MNNDNNTDPEGVPEVVPGVCLGTAPYYKTTDGKMYIGEEDDALERANYHQKKLNKKAYLTKIAEMLAPRLLEIFDTQNHTVDALLAALYDIFPYVGETLEEEYGDTNTSLEEIAYQIAYEVVEHYDSVVRPHAESIRKLINFMEKGEAT